MITAGITRAVKDFLDSVGEDYRYDADESRFEVDIELDCRLNSTRLFLLPTEGGLLIYAATTADASAEARLAAAEYITRANFGLPSGNFEMNMDDGMVTYKTFIHYGGQPPTRQAIQEGMAVPVSVLNRYGDGLLDVIENGKSPKTAITEAES